MNKGNFLPQLMKTNTASQEQAPEDEHEEAQNSQGEDGEDDDHSQSN